MLVLVLAPELVRQPGLRPLNSMKNLANVDRIVFPSNQSQAIQATIGNRLGLFRPGIRCSHEHSKSTHEFIYKNGDQEGTGIQACGRWSYKSLRVAFT